MSVSRVAVHRPVLTIMVALIVVILGLTALFRLPVDLMPDTSFPTLTISTSYANTGPEIIEELITRPVEEAMGAVPGVEEIYSTSSEGSSRVRLSFAWGTDLDAATNDVRDRLDRVVPRLPADADRPRLSKFDAASMPVMTLGASGAFDLQTLRQIIDDQVVYRLERVGGVAAVDVWGGTQRQLHVEFDGQQLRSLQVPVDQIVSRIRSGNVELPVGTVIRGNSQVNVRTSGMYGSLDDIRNTVVAVRDGIPVRLGQIATVKDATAEITRVARINGEPGIQLSISKQSGKNTVEVARTVRQEMQQINQDVPQVKLVVLNDSSDYIRYSINNVGNSALFGGLIALVILLFFLRNVGSTAVIAVSIPLSIIATFALMYFSHFTLNMMSLGGLALGIGMLVDNSIVVLENIYRLRETGEQPQEAAVRGSEEVTSAVVASTLTTLVVFLPLIFMTGMAGVMYKQLALVVSFALACSLLVALTMVPMLSARLLRVSGSVKGQQSETPLGARPRSPGGRPPEGLSALIGRLLAGIERVYRRLLHFALDHRLPVLGVVVLLLAGSLLLVPLIGNELMPATDQGQVRLSASMDQGTRLEVVDQKFRSSIEPIVEKAVPEAETVFTSVGSGGFGGGSGQVSITLKPKAERSRSDEQVAADLRRRLMAVAGVLIRVRTSQGMFMMRGGGGGTDQVQVEIRGHDLAMADRLAAQVEAAIEPIEGITDVSISRESGNPEEHLVIDRRRAADLNITPQQVSSILQTVISGSQAGTFREGSNEYPIVVQLREADRMSLEELLNLPVVATEGRSVVLGSLVRAQSQTGPSRIERRDQERIVTVEANSSGRNIGAVMKDVRQAVQGIPVPPDFSILPSGDYIEQQKANRELLISILLAVLLVYMVMAAQFESLRDPFIVLFAVPLAVIGVVLMLLFTHTAFNMQSGIGALMLGGIVVNNAILLVDQTNRLRRDDKMPLREAIEEAGRRRLRPILMTALTTTFALIPLALGLGEGGELQAPLARTVIGGLLSAAFITLLVIPTVYFILEGRKERRAARRRGAAAALLPFLLVPIGLFAPAHRAGAVENAPGNSGPLQLSVSQAVLMALENNASLKVQRLAPIIRQTYENEQRGGFDPTLTVGAATSRDLADADGDLVPEGSTGVSIFLPSGTSASASLRASPYSGALGAYAGGFDVTVTQSILKGAWGGVNLAQVEQARLDTFSSRFELKEVTESLVASTERTYWDLYLARQQAEIYQESLRLAEQHLQDTRTRIEVGTLAEIELAAAQAEVALRRSALVDAQAKVEKTRLQLLRLINPPGGKLWDRPVTLLDRPELPEEPLDEVSAHVQLSQQLRADLGQARLAVRRGELEVVRTRNGLLPRLDLFISVGMSGYADSFGGALGDMPGNLPELSGGITFSYPLGNRGAQARFERATAAQAQVEESLRNLEQLAEVDVRTAWLEANRTREQIDDTAVTRALQEEKLRAEDEKFQVGRSTTYLVAQAQRDLLAAQLSEAQAVVDHLKARIDLYRLEGSLLQRRGLEVSDLPQAEP
jgi:HAE1 family hydrophobic/amphiphilic exporter-1